MRSPTSAIDNNKPDCLTPFLTAAAVAAVHRTMWTSVKQILLKGILGIPTAIVLLDNTFYAAVVQGESMQPLLNPENDTGQDIVLLSRLRRRSFDYKRGDVVVITSPRDPTSMMIKRIIGLAGDTVRSQSRYPGDRLVLIPPGHCWIEGDHSSCSLDSNVHGPVPIGLVAAKAVAVIWPIRRAKVLKAEYPQDRVIGKLTSIDYDDDEEEN